MILEIPILIERRSDSETEDSLYHVRPLFLGEPKKQDRELSKATRRLEQKLRDDLRELASSGSHWQLAQYTFSPFVTLHWLDLRLDLKGGMERVKTAIGVFQQHDRWIAFSPYLPDLWFEIGSKSDLPERARSVLTRHFRDLENLQEPTRLRDQLRQLQLNKKPWLSVVELEVNTQSVAQQREFQQLAFLGGETQANGAVELRRVGKLVNELYPDELIHAVRRDDLVQRLYDLLKSADNRPVLLVGPSLVGKTALVHEVVNREMTQTEQQEPGKKHTHRQVWQIAPQRIVTGMSYVGQWENRWLAILKHVGEKQHVLYLDDLMGLFQAGVTSQSDLSAAEVLKPFLDQREIRVLAEITPEQLRLLRERSRGFADMFQILHVEEPSEATTLKIQLEVIRSLETRFGVRFDLEVLPTVLDLARRYQPYAAFPGKAADWLYQLAVKYQGRDVRRDDVIQEFLAKSGLKLAFADARKQLRRDEIIAALRNRIIGQEEAIEAMAEVVSIAKARLNDPERPLGSLFFLGPTGVGKTECSKALAQYLFSDESRLLRFDMNEFVSPDAAARLVGMFRQPDGLLTGAVRHQPFCVLLFDEIEKAHPDVFDLLLQILGEARLTDARGRTADFSNAVVILTSNLGTREAARELGFGSKDERSSDNVYFKAVQDFFRPEFFNRLDRIVPFQRLSREEMERIACLIIAETTGRQGLVRRKCVVDITPPALERIVDRGYDPVLGARAMRRSIERELVSPLARQLAGVLLETPTVLEAFGHGRDLDVQVTPLEQCQPWPQTARPKLEDYSALVTAAEEVIGRIVRSCQAHRPSGEMAADNISSESTTYLCVREWIEEAMEYVDQLREFISKAKIRTSPPVIPYRSRLKRRRERLSGWKQEGNLLKKLQSAEDVNEFFADLAAHLQQMSPLGSVGYCAFKMLNNLAQLHVMEPNNNVWKRERALLLVRGINATTEECWQFLRQLQWGYKGLGFNCEDIDWMTGCPVQEDPSVSVGELPRDLGRGVSGDSARHCQAGGPKSGGMQHDVNAMLLEGYRALRFAPLCNGTHLQFTENGELVVYQVVAFPLEENECVERCVHHLRFRDEQCRDVVSRANQEIEGSPFAWRPVVTLTDSCQKVSIDFRHARTTRVDWLDFSPLLPLPPEFEDC